MRLNDAKFCVDCEEIFVGKDCPRCGRDISSVYLSDWLMSIYNPQSPFHIPQSEAAA